MGILTILGLLTLLIPDSGEYDKGPALIGYDCTNPDAESSTIDLNGVQPCDVPKTQTIEEQAYYQVVQSRIYRPIHIQICLVRVTRSILRCGMHSHTSAVANGYTQKLVPLGSTQCQSLHKERSLRYSSYTFGELSPNSTNTRNVILAGTVDSSGSCNGESYSDEFGSWKNVIVQAVLDITLEDYYGVIEIKENKVILPRTGISCSYTQGYCLDSQQGEVVWSYSDRSDCRMDEIDILFEGRATKATTPNGDNILIIKDTSYTYALRLLNKDYLCGVMVYKTDHGRVYVSETSNLAFQFVKTGNIYAKNIDLIAYMGTKFLYVAHQIQVTIENAVYGLMLKECETRRMTLENRLALASITPDHIGMLTEGPGYYGRVLGEVLYIIKCVPVSVILRYSRECYQEIPIVYNNRSCFLSPVTHLIVPLGRELPCQSILHPKFMIGGKWYIRNPNLVETPSPSSLDPNTPMSWKYDTLIDVTVGGLYSIDQLQSLQTEMMFPAVRDAVSTSITRRLSNVGSSTLDMSHLWTEAEFDFMASSVASKISWFFKLFGNYTSIFIGMYICWKIGVYLIGVLTNCFILKKNHVSPMVYLSAVIDSVTGLFTTHKHLWKKQTHITSSPSAPDDDTVKPVNDNDDVSIERELNQPLRRNIMETQELPVLYPKLEPSRTPGDVIRFPSYTGGKGVGGF